LDLNGTWQFELDAKDVGEREGWHVPGRALKSSIRVPGAWQAQGFGDPSGNLRHHYTGKAWYKRTVAVPPDWNGRRVTLTIAGAMRFTTAFVNGEPVGSRESLNAPLQFDVSRQLRAGQANTIALLISNPATAVTEAPHSQDATQPTGMLNYIANWGGIYGRVELVSTEQAWIDDVLIVPDIVAGIATFRVRVRSQETGPPYRARLEANIGGSRNTADVEIVPGSDATADVKVGVPGAVLWSPDRPHLYTATISLLKGNREHDRVTERFGMREIATSGRVLLLNGKPLYLRGYGDDNIEVLDGFPPASKEVYLQRLRLAKSFGFNAMRFHSMTPVRELFEAADEVGMFVMAELPVSYTQYFLPFRNFLREELRGILLSRRNHPSFLSLAFGNEFNLGWIKEPPRKQEFLDTVAEFYRLAKSIDPRRLILSNDGYIMRPTDMISTFRETVDDAPAVRHEFGAYYCSLPDPSLIDKFTGVIVPAWLVAKKAWVEANGLGEAYPAYVKNSQRLQHFGRKYQIERARRNEHFTGYHYWLIVDFPGGTGEGDSWEEGWFDYFWNPKGTTPEQGREINTAVLPMITADVGRRTLWAGTPSQIELLVSNYGENTIRDGFASWQLLSGGTVIAESRLPIKEAPLGKISSIGRITIDAIPDDSARKLDLHVEIKDGERAYRNRWTFWSFPRDGLLKQSARRAVSTVRSGNLRRIYPFLGNDRGQLANADLLITSTLTQDDLRFLEAGGRVLLIADREQFGRSGDANFFPASGGAMGTVVGEHPALRGFPHDGLCDLQFYNLIEGAHSFSIDRFPRELQPIVGSIRTTSSFLSKQKNLSRTGYVFEARVGHGKLLVSALRLRENFDDEYPEAIYLFDRLLRYALSDEFTPPVMLSDEQVRTLVRE
jgi:hypothetical protein